eukprot:3542167-Pyramimonas_sp.AAC.1
MGGVEGEVSDRKKAKPQRRGGRRTRRGEHPAKAWSSKEKNLLALRQSILKLVPVQGTHGHVNVHRH